MGFQKSTNNYKLDYIHIPKIHPKPFKSIELTQIIINLLQNKEESLFESFKSIFNNLNSEDRYYFLNYSLEYLSFDYYDTFLQTHMSNIEKQGLDNSIILYENKTKKIISNPKHQLDSLLREVNLKAQVDDIIDYIREVFPIAEREIKISFRDKFLSIGSWFVNDEFYNSTEKINPKIYQIPLDDNAKLFIEEIRTLLNKASSDQADTFIYNSFSFKGNTKSLELCSLNFGNSTITNTLIHSIYKSYKNIVKRKISRFDFAKIMYLNFQFIRDNWNEYSKQNNDVLREDYLKTHVASNIEK